MEPVYSLPTAVPVPFRPFYGLLSQFPAVCFTLTLLTDIAFWRSSNLLWQDFSAWLLFAGLVFGGVALVVGIIEMLVRRRARLFRPSWAAILFYLIVLVLALLNSFVHAGDGWTAVVPYGLVLSAVTVAVMLLTAWLNRSTVSRGSVGVNHYA